MNKFCVLFSVLFCSLTLYGQGLKISEVKETVSGTDAFHAPTDKNGLPCGLVKVQSVIPDLSFRGDVVGEVVAENNEYKIFMAKGSKQLVIKRPEMLPLVINFPDYGIEEISSKATYNIKLKEVSLNPIKNLLVINVKPSTANVYIDDLLIDNENGDGGYRLLLPKGDHIYKIEAKGYRTMASVVKTGKGAQTINAELESLLADIDITCQTSGASIYVDGEKVGVGSWKGKLPAGNYKVEAKLEGYVSLSQSIELEEKGNLAIGIPALKRAKGYLVVKTNVNDAQVLLDGNPCSSSNELQEVQTGNHKLIVKAPFGYKSFEKDLSVKAEIADTINVKLQPLNDNYARAFAGDVKAQALICSQKIASSKYTDTDSIERNYWFEKIFNDLDKIDKQSFDLVCPCIENGAGCSVEEAGLYAYFINDYAKGLKVLQKWIKFDPNNDSVVLEMVGILSKLRNYGAVAKWGARGLDICGYDGYMGGFMYYIAEACIMLGDVNRAVNIFKEHIYKEFGWDNGYMTIANIYKEKGDCKNAVVYYKKFLQTHTSDTYGIEDAKKGIRDCGFR